MVPPLAVVRGSSLFRVGFGSPAKLPLPTRFRPSSYYRKKSSGRGQCSALEPDDVARLAGAARISLSPEETRDFAPKISQIIQWFGQLQVVNLESIEPSLRADTEVTAALREDMPEVFENREAILAEIPSYVDPYIKVPKILNKE